MALLDTRNTDVSVFAVKSGDIILDGIACLVTAVHPVCFEGDEDNPYEVSIHVIDGNGWRYFIRRTGGYVLRLAWTEDDWDAYRAL